MLCRSVSLLLLTPVPPTAAPPATLLLNGCLSQEPALARSREGGGTDQASPSATTAGSHPDPAAGRGHTTVLCCPGTASPRAKQTGLVALGRVDTELVPPAQTCCQRHLAAHPQSFGQDRGGDRPQATGLCTPPRQGTHCGAYPAVPSHPFGWGCSIWGGRWGHRQRWLPSSLVILSALDQGKVPQNSAPCTSRMNRPTRQNLHQSGGSPEPSSVQQAGEATTALQCLCCTSQPCSREGQLFKRRQKEGVYSWQGPLLRRSRRAPGRGDGERSHQPRPLRQDRDMLADFCRGDSTVWGHPGERGNICLRKVKKRSHLAVVRPGCQS